MSPQTKEEDSMSHMSHSLIKVIALEMVRVTSNLN